MIEDFKITAMRIGEFKYVNADMVKEAIDDIIERKTYFCSHSDSLTDTITDLEEISEGLKWLQKKFWSIVAVVMILLVKKNYLEICQRLLVRRLYVENVWQRGIEVSEDKAIKEVFCNCGRRMELYLELPDIYESDSYKAKYICKICKIDISIITKEMRDWFENRNSIEMVKNHYVIGFRGLVN